MKDYKAGDTVTIKDGDRFISENVPTVSIFPNQEIKVKIVEMVGSPPQYAMCVKLGDETNSRFGVLLDKIISKD